MSYATFSVSLKSTIDYFAKKLADDQGLPFFDMATSEFDANVVESDKPAICWDFDDISEAPFDPLFSCSFSIGAMTMLDPSQYISLDLVGLISQTFKVGNSFEIRNYSGAEVGEVVGQFTVTACGLAPAQQDTTTNVRFVSVSAVAVRYE